jgi:aminoglycoside 3-N-acetyltransferase I
MKCAAGPGGNGGNGVHNEGTKETEANEEMLEMRTRRLTSGEVERARHLFFLMADVFDEKREKLSDAYLEGLLNRQAFWALAAFAGDEIVGGITAHTLPMTRVESSEIFVYDIAVRKDWQRRGVGRLLMTGLCEAAAAMGIDEVFAAADNDDRHALDFYRALGGSPSPVTFFLFSR